MSSCTHDFTVIANIGADTWRLRCNCCNGQFDLTLKKPNCCPGIFENGEFWHVPGCKSIRAAQETPAAPLVLHHTFEPHKGLQMCTPDCPACAFQRTGSAANRRVNDER